MRWKPRKYKGWKPWFAWRPVEISGKMVWLEWIERACGEDWYGHRWSYRFRR